LRWEGFLTEDKLCFGGQSLAKIPSLCYFYKILEKEGSVEPIEFWGIAFKGAHHLRWFQGALVGFIIVSLLVICLSFWNVYCGLYLFDFLAFVFLIFSLVAVIGTSFGTSNNHMFSIDCIWFNALVALAFVLLRAIIFLVYRITHRKTVGKARQLKNWF
jgi:hypothetical protein